MKTFSEAAAEDVESHFVAVILYHRLKKPFGSFEMLTKSALMNWQKQTSAKLKPAFQSY